MPPKKIDREELVFYTLEGEKLGKLGEPVSLETVSDEAYSEHKVYLSVGKSFEGKAYIMSNNERKRKGLPLMRGRLNGNRWWRLLLKVRGRE